jgi:hypothetical protein
MRNPLNAYLPFFLYTEDKERRRMHSTTAELVTLAEALEGCEESRKA